MFGFGKYSAQILTPPPISKKQTTMPAKPKIRKDEFTDSLPDFKHTPPAPQNEMVNGPQHYG
jgi:hypothetical protein